MEDTTIVTTQSLTLANLVQTQMVTKQWIEALPDAFLTFIAEILPTLKITSHYPDTINIFKTLKDCGPDAIKVVILFQDPYPDGSATGLAVDNKKGSKLSLSLRKLITELDADSYPVYSRRITNENTYLEHLPPQGVLLLNTALTVEPDKPGSHIKLWKNFTDQLIKYINSKDNIVWVLFGNYAKAYKELITNPTHSIIEGAHPAARGKHNTFANGKYFSKCNEILQQKGVTPIHW